MSFENGSVWTRGHTLRVLAPENLQVLVESEVPQSGLLNLSTQYQGSNVILELWNEEKNFTIQNITAALNGSIINYYVKDIKIQNK